MKLLHHARQNIKTVTCCILWSLLVTTTSMATTYYVSPSGNDSNPGTLSRPWRTLAMANNTLQPGDTVYIRQGVYQEDINPVRSGYADAMIVYANYEDEEAVLQGFGNGNDEAVVAIGYPGSAAGWGSCSHIVIQGLHIRPSDASYGIAIYGGRTENIVVRDCNLYCIRRTAPRTHGILVGQARNTLIENNIFDGGWGLGIITTGSPKYTVIRNNRILNCYASGIDIQTSYGENQAMIIESNVIAGSVVEDGIQFEPDYSGYDPGSKRGVIIRNNAIYNNAENAVDLKGAADVIIEGNIIWGNRGDNNGSGNLGGGTGGIMKGDITFTQAHDILIRNNIIFDNLGGVYITNYGWIVVHNTIIGNNRSYLGPDNSANTIETDAGDYCRRRPGLVGIAMMEGSVDNFNGCVIKNNIIGGNHQGELALRTTADLSEAEIDGNLYFNQDGVILADLRSAWNWDKIGMDEYRTRLMVISGPIGKEENSFYAADPGFVNATDAPVDSGAWDFSLIQGSSAIDKGLCLTRTISAGSGTEMAIENARFFTDGYEIVQGDEIQIASSGDRARIISIDYVNNILFLDRSVAWQNNDGISMIYSGSAPDIGAKEYVSVSSSDLSVSAGADRYTGSAPLDVQFTANINGGSAPYTFQWDFGDNRYSDERNPSHTYESAGLYRVVLSVTDALKESSVDSLTIDVTGDEGSLAITGVKLSLVDRTEKVTEIVQNRWYDIYLYISDPLGWDHIAFADVWLSAASFEEGSVENRGGVHYSARNYVLSFSIAENTIWIKEREGSSDWDLVDGRVAGYVDNDNNEYQQNSLDGWVKVRIMLLQSSEIGKWTIHGVLYDNEQNISSLFSDTFEVVSSMDPPCATIILNTYNISEAIDIEVTLETSQPVISIPLPLNFIASDQSKMIIELNGIIPGSMFKGILNVDDSIPEGLGRFTLGDNALLDVYGAIGNQIISGTTIYIDKGPPASPRVVTIKK